MSETSLNTGEMLFQLRVWDYLAWALDDMASLVGQSERVGQVRDSATGQTVCGMR